MDRDIIEDLEFWKISPQRKPLILNGARQVGKTTTLKAFGAQSFEKTVYLNFERDEALAGYFEQTLDPATLIKTLGLHTNTHIEAHNTLIIFDEVQECPRALNSLKYFCEEARDYSVIGAGSLLGVKLANERGFPVGKVNFLHMFPMSFFEFLQANGEKLLREHLETISAFEPLPEPLHLKLMHRLKEYFFIGGMPEAVYNFINTQDYNKTREIQLEILDAYQRDFAKHAPTNQVMKIMTVWDQIHKQLAKENKKFILSAIKKSARGREYEEAIQWLIEAGLIYKSSMVEMPHFPLDVYASSSIYKLFMLDVGLLGARSQLNPKIIIEGDKSFIEFKGALTENFIAQELKSRGDKQLYYWTSSGSAEVDFLREYESSVYPLEVKSGESSKKKSLLKFGEQFSDAVLSRVTSMNLKHDGKIYNYPLYLVGRFPFNK